MEIQACELVLSLLKALDRKGCDPIFERGLKNKWQEHNGSFHLVSYSTHLIMLMIISCHLSPVTYYGSLLIEILVC